MPTGTPLIRIANISENKIDLSSCVYIQEKVDDRFTISYGDLLIAMSGATTGKMGVYLHKDKALLNQRVGNLKIINLDSLLPEYRNYFMQSKVNEILKRAYGGAQPNISSSNICDIDFLLPPLKEQHRIVEKVKYWFALIDIIESGKDDLQETIKQAKSKILDLAIHGKLVPQDPSDEPATELLKRFNPKAEIVCDNPQYGKLPNGWCEVQLGDVFNHNTGKALNASNTEGSMKRYLTTSNVYWNTFDFTTVKQMYYKDSELDKCSITKGDLLICEGGDVGRAAIWNFNYDICIQNHLHRLRPKLGDLCVSLYYYVFYYLKVNNMIGGKGIGLLGLSSNALHKLHVPLPPINEQHRIVAKIEELFAQLDNKKQEKLPYLAIVSPMLTVAK